MATTFIDYTGDGNASKSFSFPSIQESDVKVDVDGVIKSSTFMSDSCIEGKENDLVAFPSPV